MNDDDLWLEVAARILDGTPVAGDTVPAGRTDADAVSIDDLRLIADVAEIHRSGDDIERGRWGPLEILEKIGHGTFGDVYRARDTALDRDVALKLLEHGRIAAASDEGRLLARVRHPNVVTVHGAAEHGGRYGIWMEFVRGRTLAAIVRENGPLPWKEAAQIGVDVCAALAAVHQCGLLHGDVKAQNVMRDAGGRIVLMDFGTGRFASDPTARLAGTPLYLAPEVLAGCAPDVRADVYSAGVLLYYLLTGKYPVDGQTLDEVRGAHERGVRTPLRDRRIDCPRTLLAAIDRATAPDPASRCESAAAFESSLRDVMRPPSSRRRHALAPAAEFASARRRRTWIGGVCGLAILAAGVAIPWTRASAQHQKALNSYEASRQLGEAFKWAAAANAAKQAVADDPRFPVAHMWLAWCLFNVHAPQDQVVVEADRAIAWLSSAPARERYWIEAVNHDVRGERTRAIRAYETLLADRIWPDRDDARERLIALLERSGQESQAVSYATRRADLHPQDAAATLEALNVLADTGNFERAREYARRVEQLLKPTPIAVVLLPAREAYFHGDAPLAANCLDAAIARLGDRLTTSFSAAEMLARFELTLGRSSVARRIAAAAHATASPSATRWHLLRAGIAYWDGDRSAFQAEAPVVGATGGFGYGFADYLADTGMLDLARATQSSMEGRLRTLPDSEVERALAVSRAHIASANGHPQEAIAALENVVPDSTSFEYQERYYVLASAYLALDRVDDARVALQQALPQQPEYLFHLGWLRNVMLRAEVDHRDHQEEDEARAVAILERAFGAADHDFPLLVRLKALEAKSHATGAAAGFHARDWVLVSNFDNRTDDRQFDRTIEHALEYQLTNSAYVNVVPPSRVEDALQLMKRPPDTVVTAAIAREVAVRDGNIRLIIDGWIERVGKGYAMTARVVDPADGAVIASDREEAANVDGIRKSVQALSNWVRLTLGEAPVSVKRDAEQNEKVTTPSLEAVRLFSDGIRAFNRVRLPEAEAMFTAALNADSSFASAYAWLARTRQNMRKPPDEYLPSLQRAMDLAPSVSEREREWITGSFYVLTDRDDQALGVFEAMVRRYPDDFWALRNLIEIYNRAGRRGELLDIETRAAAALPFDFRRQAQVAMEMVQRYGPVAARPVVARALRVLPRPDDNPDDWTTNAKIWILLFPAHDFWTQGHAAAAAHVLDAVANRPEYAADRTWTLNMLGQLRLALGQVRLAEQTFGRIEYPIERTLGLASVALARGEHAGLAAQLKEHPVNDFSAVSLLIRAGDLDAAAKLVSTIKAPVSVEQHRGWSADEIEEARGNRARIEVALRAGAPWTNVMTGWRTFMYSETLARAAASIGERDAAIRTLELTAPIGSRAYPFFSQSGFYWMRNQKLLADLYREAGQPDKARAIERDLLARLAVADADYPLLVELKQRMLNDPK